MLPLDQLASFVEALDLRLGLWPLWFCPLRNFSPQTGCARPARLDLNGQRPAGG